MDPSIDELLRVSYESNGVMDPAIDELLQGRRGWPYN